MTISTGSNRNLHCIIEGARPGEVLELSRLYLDDDLPKNSESRVLSICRRLLKKRTTNLVALVTYTEGGGYLYEAAGWQFAHHASTSKQLVVDGVAYYANRAVDQRFGTSVPDELRRRGHCVEERENRRQCYVCWIQEGRLARTRYTDAHPLEKEIQRLWSTAHQWLGWPGTETIRKSLHDGSNVIVWKRGKIVGAWLVSRLSTRPVFRGIGCVVDARHRGAGVGRELCERMQGLCEAEGRLLTFDVKSSNPAVAFWQRMGFRWMGFRYRGKDRERYERFVYIPRRKC